MNIEHFQRDIDSFRRVMTTAAPEKRKDAFKLIATEGVRMHTVGEAPKADVMDALQDVGRSGGLDEATIQAALEHAVEHPFDPAAVATARMLPGVEIPRREPLRPLRIDELLALDVQPRVQILSPILPEKGLAMVYAMRGVGKTHLALGISYACAAGGEFLTWKATRPHRVLYIDGEMPMAVLKERVDSINVGTRPQADPANFQMLAADFHPNGLPNLATREGQAELEGVLEGVELIVLDNLSTLVPAVRDNDSDSWSSMQEWLLRQRRAGRAVLLVHHAGKGGQQRGTSRREDVLDTSIALRHPSDYTQEDGARFEVHIEKARGAFGSDVKPFEARMQVINGATVWSTRDLSDANLSRVIDLLTEGLSIREVAEETGIKRSTVGRLKKQAEAQGHTFPRGAKHDG